MFIFLLSSSLPVKSQFLLYVELLYQLPCTTLVFSDHSPHSVSTTFTKLIVLLWCAQNILCTLLLEALSHCLTGIFLLICLSHQATSSSKAMFSFFLMSDLLPEIQLCLQEELESLSWLRQATLVFCPCTFFYLYPLLWHLLILKLHIYFSISSHRDLTLFITAIQMVSIAPRTQWVPNKCLLNKLSAP